MTDPELHRILVNQGQVLEHHTKMLEAQTKVLETILHMAAEPIDDTLLLDTLTRIQASLDQQTIVLTHLLAQAEPAPPKPC